MFRTHTNQLNELAVVEVFVAVLVGVVQQQLEATFRHVFGDAAIKQPRFELVERNAILAELKQLNDKPTSCRVLKCS